MSIESESVAWLDLGFRFLEPWVYPMGPEFTFVKAFEWEVREFPATSERIVAPEGMCVELKWLDQDEFAHWSAHRLRRRRARRASAASCEVYRALTEGRGDEVEGLHRIEAPPGVHVVDHVTRTWMARRRGRWCSGRTRRGLAVDVRGRTGPRRGADSPDLAARCGTYDRRSRSDRGPRVTSRIRLRRRSTGGAAVRWCRAPEWPRADRGAAARRDGERLA